MKVIVKNETKSALGITHLDGGVTIVRSGEVVAVELTKDQLKAISSCSDLTFEPVDSNSVEPVEPVEPVELDNDLLELAIADGFKPDGRWSEERTAQELEKFLTEKGE